MERQLRSTPSPGQWPRWLKPAVLGAAFACGHATGEVALQLEIASVSGAGWHAEGVSVALRRDASGRLTASLSATRLELPPPIGPQEAVRGACRDLVITPRRFSCNDLEFAAPASTSAGLALTGRLDYQRDTGALGWALASPAEGSGALRTSGRLDSHGWAIEVKTDDWPVDTLAQFGEMLNVAVPLVTGRLDLSLVARGRGAALQGLVFDVATTALAGGNETGTIAAEGLDLELRGSAWPRGERLAFDIRGAISAGEAYVEPVYVNLEDHPVRLVARGLAGRRNVTFDQLLLDQHATVHADASAELERAADDGWQLARARMRVSRAEFPGAYTVLLQPFLAGSAFADLATSGELHGELVVRDGALAGMSLDLADVHLDDQQARLAVYGLSGNLGWTRAGEHVPTGPPVELRWSGGFVYGIPFGAAGVRLDPLAGRWALAAPVSIPLLDGALEIDGLEFGDFTAGDYTLLFDARLAPVSMRELSRALDWPPMSGRLSGTLPQLSHADGVLTLGGELTAEVFGGVVAIRELRVQRPLQPRARLQAEVELHGLELAEATEALSFGLMTGRLDGYVRGLEMIDWAPVAFDARLQTPPGDRSRKRISQRAVDNIASIGGGGGAGALSTGFLRFFEDFSYDAFALGCRLERDVCEMSGLDQGEQGYVILRGRGLPRIDVMGFARQVSWSALVEQLQVIMESEGPELR